MIDPHQRRMINIVVRTGTPEQRTSEIHRLEAMLSELRRRLKKRGFESDGPAAETRTDVARNVEYLERRLRYLR